VGYAGGLGIRAVGSANGLNGNLAVLGQRSGLYLVQSQPNLARRDPAAMAEIQAMNEEASVGSTSKIDGK
jgi:hypothetical protein